MTTGAGGRLTTLCLMVFVLSGCAVGPDFVRPPPPGVTAYTAEPVSGVIASGAGYRSQRLHPGGALPAQWWALFRWPRLNSVVVRALRENPTLDEARATLAAAQENVAVARGGLFPQLDLSASAQRLKSAGGQTDAFAPAFTRSGISNLYSLGTNVSYDADVFGGIRRRVEQQQALAEKQNYQLAAACLVLTGDAVTQAITIAALRAQIEATEAVIRIDEQTLSLVRQEYAAGKVPRTDVLTAGTELASDRAQLPVLEQALSTARHALALLAGQFPANWSPPDFSLDDFSLPENLPITLPSKLVQQRPDILAAQAQLHADSAAIGVATAQLFPSITLSGSIGQEALDTSSIFSAVNRFWSLSAGVLAPVFHGGALMAQRRAAMDIYKASLANYELTVLQGFEQVGDTLRALVHDAQLLDAEQAVFDSASESLKMQRTAYTAGKVTILSLIDAERVYQQARLSLVRARAQRLQDSAQLLVALGGGWWNNAAAIEGMAVNQGG